MSFESVYERHSGPLFRYVHRFTGEVDVANDVVQEAFCRYLTSSVPEEEARPWLFRVATNLVRDRARRGRRRDRLLRRFRDPRDEVTPASDTERSLRVAAVRTALDMLDQRQRQMLLMREEGFSYGEIAAAVGVAPGSVGALLTRARNRFRQAYAGPDAGGGG